jgi:hypothetical protein
VEPESATRLLGVLLLFDISLVGYLGLRLCGEIQRTQWYAAQMENHRLRADSLESELENLRPYAVIADAERHSAGILASAHAQAHDIAVKYGKYVDEVIAWTEAAFESATAQAMEIVRGAKSPAKSETQPQTKTQPLPKNRFFGNNVFPVHRVVEGPLDPVEELPERVVSHPARRARTRREDWQQNEMLFDLERRVA